MTMRRRWFVVGIVLIFVWMAESTRVMTEETDKKTSVENAKQVLANTAANGVELLSKGWEWFGFKTGLGHQCKFVENPSKAVRAHLQAHLKAQDQALENIVAAVEAWEFTRTNKKDHAPLVLAITGSTGTGKTETSNLLAEALFKHRRRLHNSEKEVPTGLLVFRGEDFSDNFTNPLTEYHEQIKKRLAAHLSYCSGNAIVVFDEVQKVIPHTLDVLTSAMGSNPQLTYYNNGVARKIDCSNVIFLLISDIGVSNMERLLFQYEDRAKVPYATLESEVKKALDNQWERLQFGKHIHQVIPFLPFEQEHIIEVIDLKLKQLSQHYSGKYWDQLTFQEGVASHLSRLDSLAYLERRAVINGVTVRKVFAKYGARSIESGPLQQLKSKLLRHAFPQNPKINITVALNGDDIEIISCYEEIQPGSDFISTSCVSKWRGKFV